MASRKREQGYRHAKSVTHRPRGRWTIVSPQNMTSAGIKEAMRAAAACPICGSHKKTKRGSRCKACALRKNRALKKAGKLRKVRTDQ